MTRPVLRDARGIEPFAGDDLAAFPVPPHAKRAAMLAICARASGPEDARLLLEACGLVSYRRGPHQTYSYGRRS